MSEEEQVAHVISLHKKDRRELIPLLQEIQKTVGYLPQYAFQSIADQLGISPSAVYGVVTFYNEFRLTPLGKNHFKVCMGTACHLQGGGLVLEAVERELDLEVGGVTEDREYSLDRVACVGCCSLAPVVLVNDVVKAKVTTNGVEELLARIKQEQQDSEKGEARNDEP